MALHFEPNAGPHRQDPYPHYARFREDAPVHEHKAIDGVVLTRHDDCLAALLDPRLGNDARGLRSFEAVKARHARSGGDERDLDDPGMLGLDGPEHLRLRGLVSRGFTPREVRALEPRIAAIARELLDPIAPGAEFDLMQTLAQPLPAIAIAEMLGVPKEDRPRFQAWAADVVAGGILQPRALRRRAVQAGRAQRRYFGELVEKRRAEPRDDILSTLIRVEQEDGVRLNLPELISTCSLLLLAGHATTQALIGNGVLALLRNPEALAQLREDEGLWRSAVEEMLRYDCAIHSMIRVAKEDLQLRGKCLRKGQTAMLVLAAANRDPAVFPEPDRFEIRRDPNDHLSFGRGRHFCLGASLARLEIRIAIAALLERFARLELVTHEIDWARGGIRAAAALPVRGAFA